MRKIAVAIASILLFTSSVLGQKREVLIIGTMHEVPKIVKHSYKPLLRKGKKYKPDAIYVERQRPNDSLSLINYESGWFLPLGDSLRKSFRVDESRTSRLMSMGVSEMTQDDYEYLRDYYAVSKDKSNWYYYRYLTRYGLKGSRKPIRNENSDLTSKLAIYLDMNFIFAMDHQHETQLYSKLERASIIQTKKNGELDIYKKLNKKSYNKAIIPSLFGQLWRYTNKVSTVELYQKINRFSFGTKACEPCEAAAAIWDRRNAGMAKNIGSQMKDQNHKRAIVIVGAGHVLGIRAELQKQFPELKVKILSDL